MLISATGNRRRSQGGFTLVEAMTALMVVAFVAGIVFLMAPSPDREARTQTERFAQRLALASDESVMRNQTVALVMNDDGYGFERLSENGWAPVEPNSPLRFRAWPAGLSFRVEEPEAVKDGRVARFDAMGGATPARILIAGGGVRWRVEIDGQGSAHVARTQ
jgi:type II secretion system protein H